MARVLNFKMGGNSYSAEPSSIDRKKLYGWTEVVALDDEGNECKIATMDSSGTVIIPPKGTAQAILDSKKNWVEKSTTKAVTANGESAQLIPSSYSVDLALDKTVTLEEYLDHTISQFYELFGISEEFRAALNDKIYTFPYSYSDSYEAKTAFIMCSDDKVFMLIGVKNNFEMIGLTEQSVISEDEAGEDDAAEEFDFSNMF